MTALEHMRRRSRAMAWAMMPLLVVMWLVTSAACPGMTPGDAHAGAGHTAETAHDHGAHDPLHHGGGSDAHTHAPIDHSATDEHPGCPHCGTPPTSDETGSEHAVCAASESTVAAPAHSAAQPDLKPFLLPIALIAPAAAAPLIRASGPSAYSAPGPEPRSLNVRYCVYLL